MGFEDTLQRFKEEGGEKKRGTAQHIGNKTSNWRAIATLPDYCKVGDSTVGFDSSANLEKKVVASPDVKAQSESKPVYRVGDLFRNIDGDAGSHLTSGTSQESGHVRINSGQDNVKVNGKPVAKDGSFCQVNCNSAGEGGTVGKLVSEKKVVDSSFQGGGGQSGRNGASGFWGKGASGSWDTPMLGDGLLGNVSKAGEFVREKGLQFGTEAWNKTKEIGQSIADTSSLVWAALGTSAQAQAAQAQIGNGILGTMENLGTLIGPSPEMMQAAYSPWGIPEMRELVEQMQHNQQVAGKAVTDSIAQDVSETYQRNGVAGVVGRAFPTVVEAVVGSKGTVALTKVAGKVGAVTTGAFKASERVAELTTQAKNSGHLSEMLDKEITLAKANRIPESEIKKLEKAKQDALEKVKQEGKQQAAGVHVKKYTKEQLETAKRKGVNPEWVDENGYLKWPPNDGFDGPPNLEKVNKGTLLDRYGDNNGGYLALEGTPFGERALPANDINRTLRHYEVIKDVELYSGPAKSWFDQPGGGIQFMVPDKKDIDFLIREEYLSELK